MRYERMASLLVVVLAAMLTVAGSHLTAVWAKDATGLLPIKEVSGTGLVGALDKCTHIDETDLDDCPQVTGKMCTNMKLVCVSGSTEQTRDALCNTSSTTDVCQDVEGTCKKGTHQNTET